MSVRAYRIEKIETTENPSFNLWHDTDVMEFLQNIGEYHNFMGDDDYGFLEISVATLKILIKDFKGLDSDIKEQLREDIAWAESKKEDWVQYECY